MQAISDCTAAPTWCAAVFGRPNPLLCQCPALQGRPVYIQHVGTINMKKMYELTSEERMIKFHVQARGDLCLVCTMTAAFICWFDDRGRLIWSILYASAFNLYNA